MPKQNPSQPSFNYKLAFYILLVVSVLGATTIAILSFAFGLFLVGDMHNMKKGYAPNPQVLDDANDYGKQFNPIYECQPEDIYCQPIIVDDMLIDPDGIVSNTAKYTNNNFNFSFEYDPETEFILDCSIPSFAHPMILSIEEKDLVNCGGDAAFTEFFYVSENQITNLKNYDYTVEAFKLQNGDSATKYFATRKTNIEFTMTEPDDLEFVRYEENGYVYEFTPKFYNRNVQIW